jgi:pyruvate/2-oxoglutarate dehydrogenase complex dihydrolipoamide acyltransferase (E2) component
LSGNNKDHAASVPVTVPDLGNFTDVSVIDVLVEVGDRVEVDTPLITLETDKATMDVPSSHAGVVASLAVKKGDKVSTGSAILTLTRAPPVEEDHTTTASALRAAEPFGGEPYVATD